MGSIDMTNGGGMKITGMKIQSPANYSPKLDPLEEGIKQVSELQITKYICATIIMIVFLISSAFVGCEYVAAKKAITAVAVTI
jgi:hypothetical protein